MQNTFFVLLPPIIVLISALITRKLHSSLLIGLFSAALIATDGNPATALILMGRRLVQHIVTIDNIYLYLFLICVSILIVLLERTGAARAFAHALTTRLRSARMTEISTMLMSMSLFIDDYLSTLTVGYVMEPLTDLLKVPPAKLALLVHSLSAPFVILIPISSWVAMLTRTS